MNQLQSRKRSSHHVPLQQPTQTPLLQSVGTSPDRKELLTAAGTHDDLDGLNDLGVYWIEPQNRCNVNGCPHHHNCEERENLVHSAGVCTDNLQISGSLIARTHSCFWLLGNFTVVPSRGIIR